MRVPEIHYRSATPAQGQFPGAHRSRRGDSGFEFRAHARLHEAPDPRRLDLMATLRDPFGLSCGNWLVRVHSQRMAMPVIVLLDLSASMGFEGARRRLDVAADFIDSLSHSAWRTGDSFGFTGCAEQVVESLWLPPTRARGAATPLLQQLRTLVPQAHSAAGLLQATERLPRQRSLVFVLSDFHFGAALRDELLARLAPHEPVPVVLWDTLEFTLGARRGLAQLQDPETGARQLVWWRPALRERWLAREQAGRAELLQGLRATGARPLVIEGAFDADAVTRHFHT